MGVHMIVDPPDDDPFVDPSFVTLSFVAPSQYLLWSFLSLYTHP